MAKLVEISGYTPGREILVGDSLVLGRDPGDGGLVIANREASRKHARIRKVGAGYFIEDLSSANGTYVNGIRRPTSPLAEGMLLTVGRTTFKFSLEPIRMLASLPNVLPNDKAASSATGSNANVSTPIETVEAADADVEVPSDEVTISRPVQPGASAARISQAARNLASGWNDLSESVTTSGSGQAGRAPKQLHQLTDTVPQGVAQSVLVAAAASAAIQTPLRDVAPLPQAAPVLGAPVAKNAALNGSASGLVGTQGSAGVGSGGQAADLSQQGAAPPLPVPERRRAPVWNLMLDARSTQMGEAPNQEPENLERERDILHLLCEISRTLGSILHLPALVQEILLKAFELFPAAENASIHLLDKEHGLQPLAARSKNGGEIVPPPISQTIANMAQTDRQSILSTDAAGDERFLNKQSIILHRVRSFMCSPLLFRDEVLGVLYVDTTDARPRFTPEDLRLFTAVSAQVAVAVKNSQLMVDNLREAEVRLHLSRYLPPDLVDQVLHKQIDITPGGSLYEGTVLFSDVVGFTPMSERLGPVQLVTTLNRYFRHMVEVVFRNAGSVNKFGGDSIMALWGVPVKQGDDVLRAVCAGVEMQVAVFGFNLAVPDESEPLRVGIGLNTGTFVMGNVGSMQHMEYTALGNHVNLAQRVESQASSNQVFLSENTYLRVADKISAFVLPPKLLKGVRVPTPIYSVRAVRWQSEVLCAIPGVMLWASGMTAPCMLARAFPDQTIEVWTSRRPEPGSELLLRLDPPEYPAMTVMSVIAIHSEELKDFVQDSNRQGWRVRLRSPQPLPTILQPAQQLEPKIGCEYLPRG